MFSVGQKTQKPKTKTEILENFKHVYTNRQYKVLKDTQQTERTLLQPTISYYS